MYQLIYSLYLSLLTPPFRTESISEICPAPVEDTLDLDNMGIPIKLVTSLVELGLQKPSIVYGNF